MTATKFTPFDPSLSTHRAIVVACVTRLDITYMLLREELLLNGIEPGFGEDAALIGYLNHLATAAEEEMARREVVQYLLQHKGGSL